MKKKTHSARFFCDNCGTEVPRAAKKCPRCGRFFSSVKCPACGFEGDVSLFKQGCPACGHSEEKAPAPKKTSTGEHLLNAGPLPFWAYAVSLLALLLVSVVFYCTIK